MRIGIRELREKLGLTIEELAKKASVDKTMIARLEDNSVDICDSKIICRIANALGVYVSDIFIYDSSDEKI